VGFFNALIASGNTKSAFVKRNAQKTQPLTVRAGRKDVKCLRCEGNHLANYKGCIIYKNLQKSFFRTLRRKMVASESQPRIEPLSIQTRLV